MTAEELETYLDALDALLEGSTQEGDRVVLPRTDADGDRAYVHSPEDLLGYVDLVAEAVEAHPESERARALLARWILLDEAFLAGRLYAGDLQLELPWRGRTDTEERRAARDRSLARRREAIEQRVAKARALLG
jgi:hypothetical protein